MKKLIDLPKNKDWLDYSGLSMYQRCPRMYYWRSILNIATAGVNAALVNGQAYHEALAAYENARVAGCKWEEAVKMGLEAGKPFMLTIIDDPARNLSVFTETFILYCTRWKDESYSTIATEIGFAIDMGPFTFIGKVDRFVDSPFGKMIMEHKTTSIVGERWSKRVKPNLQIDGYYAGIYYNLDVLPFGACLDVIPIHKDSKKRQEPFRLITPRGKAEVEAWRHNVLSWHDKIAVDKLTGIWPMNTENCNPMMGFSCDYCSLCQSHPDPVTLDQIDLPGEFVVSEWQPWELQGEKK